MTPLQIIRATLDEGWQINAVWIVPASSHISTSGGWELVLHLADFVPHGEGDSPCVTIDRANVPKSIRVLGGEKMGDRITQLSPMSNEQAEAIARDIALAGDATGVVKTASGCWSVGPTAAWVRDPLRTAIINSRKK